MEFNKGDRVRMSSIGKKNYTNYSTNPHDLEGTIITPNAGDKVHSIRVLWDNGNINVYRPAELDMVLAAKEIKEDKPMANQLDKELEYMDIMFSDKKDTKSSYEKKEPTKSLSSYDKVIDEYDRKLADKIRSKSTSSNDIWKVSIEELYDPYVKKAKVSEDTLSQLKRPIRAVGYTPYKPTLKF